jgi:membrane fusion protein, multidrug efflux system
MNARDVTHAEEDYSPLAQELKPRRSAKRRLVGGIVLVLSLAGYWSYTRFHDQPVGAQKLAVAAPVRVAAVTRRDVPVVEHTLGKVIANTMIQVTSRVQGVLESANFKEGQLVKKGDLLFQIDARGFTVSLAQARAVLARDEFQLKNANRDMERYKSLFSEGAASSQKLDTTATNAEVLVATVAADKAAVAVAQLNVDYAQIRSPVDGKTGPILVQPGNMIVADSPTPLVTIAQLQPIKVSFALPQTDLPKIQERQRTQNLLASLDILSADGRPLAAPVDFTDNGINAQSGTVELRATFGNDKFELVPGQLVNVTVELNSLPNALVVPHAAVNDGPEGAYVYVVADGKAEAHKVKVLFDDDKNTAVQGDLTPGDPVIIEGQLRIVPGVAVSVLPPKSDASADALSEGNLVKKRGPP